MVGAHQRSSSFGIVEKVGGTQKDYEFKEKPLRNHGCWIITSVKTWLCISAKHKMATFGLIYRSADNHMNSKDRWAATWLVQTVTWQAREAGELTLVQYKQVGGHGAVKETKRHCGLVWTFVPAGKHFLTVKNITCKLLKHLIRQHGQRDVGATEAKWGVDCQWSRKHSS